MTPCKKALSIKSPASASLMMLLRKWNLALRKSKFGKRYSQVAQETEEKMETLQETPYNEGLEEIQDKAFDGCLAVYHEKGILIPKTVKKIGTAAFGSPTMPFSEWIRARLRVYKNSYAEQYAKDNGIDYEIVD